MASGGARAGAGRKKKSEKYGGHIAAAEDRIADVLPKLIDGLIESGLKGHKVVVDTFEPAGTIIISCMETVANEDGSERMVKAQKLAFPDKKPEEMVLVKRTVSQTAPDRDAKKYLTDRIMGRPVQMVEAEIAEKQEIPDALMEAIVSAYGEKDDEDEPDNDHDSISVLDDESDSENSSDEDSNADSES